MRTLQSISIMTAAVLLFSCTEEIPFDLNDEGFDRLVVEGSITDQVKVHEVYLSRTTSYFEDEQPPKVSGASVSISNALDTWDLIESPFGSGRYITPSAVAGTAGLMHTLSIEVDGETYSASDYMYDTATIDSLAVELVEPDDEEEDPYWGILLWTQETPGVGDFYRWRPLINGETDTDSITNLWFSDDILFDGTILEGYEMGDFSTDDLMLGDTFTLEQHGISEEYYDMLTAAYEQTQFQGGLFDPPPANVPTNLTNGALGFFFASSVSEKTIVVE